VVGSWPEQRNEFLRTTLEVSLVKDQTWKEAKGKIQLYIPLDQVDSIEYGSVLLIKGMPGLTRAPRNPYEFDYKGYLAHKNIFHQQFLNPNDFKVAGQEVPSKLKYLAGKLRTRAKKTIGHYIDQKERSGIASAMLIGDRSGMDVEIREAYAHTGAMHVLAISGLHVGILYGLLSLLLAPLKKHRMGKALFTFIILIILWSYAFIVGASPSVMRAVVMFSLIAIGQVFFRTPNIFNTIAFSAFFLLILDPFQLYEVGFQLSYLAVLGIVLMYRNINSWITAKYRIVNTLWSITSVAIAAQLMTFPIALFYFHNFPNLFFLSNLIVIPGAMVIVISGISLLFISIFSAGIIPATLGKFISFTIGVMNSGVSFIESIPFSSTSDLFLSLHMVILIYLLIVSGLAVLSLRNVRWLYFLALSWSALIISYTISDLRKNKEQLLMIYDISNATVVDYIYEGEVQTYQGKELDKDIGYNVDNFRIAMAGTIEPEPLPYLKDSLLEFSVLYFNNKSLVHVDHSFSDSYYPVKKMSIDFLLISNNSVHDFDRLLEIFEPAILLMDSSNGYYYSKTNMNSLKDKDMEVYSTRESGGLLIDLKSGAVKSDDI
jgi:competence protein ComEC